MAGCGGMNPCPARCGGGPSPVKPILDSLNQQMGSGIDVTPGSPNYVENVAAARILAGMRATGERLGALADPARTPCLSRWEKILDLRPKRTDTEADRRAAFMAKRVRDGQPIEHAFLENVLRERLGPFFVAIEYTDITIASFHKPDSSYPAAWGTVVAGFPWYSTLEHILVRIQKPVGASEGDFNEAAGKVVETLNPMLPSTCTFDWYRSPGLDAIAVTGGASAAGIFLYRDHNLDNHVFDE